MRISTPPTAPLTITSLSPSSVASGGSCIHAHDKWDRLHSRAAPEIRSRMLDSISSAGPTFSSYICEFNRNSGGCARHRYRDARNVPTLCRELPIEHRGVVARSSLISRSSYLKDRGSGATTVTATPAALSFPSTTVDQTSASQTITVKNTGSVATTIGDYREHQFRSVEY